MAANPKILETKNKTEAELETYLKNFFQRLEKNTALKFVQEDLERIAAKYKGGLYILPSPRVYASYINLYGEDFFDMVYYAGIPVSVSRIHWFGILYQESFEGKRRRNFDVE